MAALDVDLDDVPDDVPTGMQYQRSGTQIFEQQAAPSDERPQPSRLVQFMRNITQFLFHPFMERDPCGAVFTVRQCINSHKLLVPAVYVPMIYYFSNRDGGERNLTLTGKDYGPAAMCLLVCHTIYGISWVAKDVHFPDPSWRTPMTVLGFILVFLYPLGTYYLPMFCLMSRKCPGNFAVGNELWIVGLGLVCYLIGFFYHFCADTQKYFVLKYQRPRNLISDGLLAHSRNPNYFGEIMLYTGYAIWSGSYIILPIFMSTWVIIFWPNMLAKEASMSRYPQHAKWKSRTGFVVPWIPSLLYDILVHGLNKMGIPEEDSLLA